MTTLTSTLVRAIVDDLLSEDLGFKIDDIMSIKPDNEYVIVMVNRHDLEDYPNGLKYNKLGNFVDWLWLQ